MSEINKRKNIKVESKAIDKELINLRKSYSPILYQWNQWNQLRLGGKRREPKYSMVAEAIKLVAKMSKECL